MLGEVLELPEHLNAFLLGHLHVEHHHVVGALAQSGERALAVPHAFRFQAAPGQLADDQVAQVVLVVGDQDPDRALHPGNTTRKMLPLPTCVCISMRPP